MKDGVEEGRGGGGEGRGGGGGGAEGSVESTAAKQAARPPPVACRVSTLPVEHSSKASSALATRRVSTLPVSSCDHRQPPSSKKTYPHPVLPRYFRPPASTLTTATNQNPSSSSSSSLIEIDCTRPPLTATVDSIRKEAKYLDLYGVAQ